MSLSPNNGAGKPPQPVGLPAVDCAAIAQARLSPKHLADLRASGLTDETIAAAGLFSSDDYVKIADALNLGLDKENLARTKAFGFCLVLPYFAADGTPLIEKGRRFYRIKPDNPPTIRDKVAKYLSPKRSRNHPYFPPLKTLHDAINNPYAEILITEGEKKALAACQNGFATIAISGVWNWVAERPVDENGRKVGSKKLLPELAAVGWKYRPAAIVFDSDAIRNPQVRSAEKALARALMETGAS
jgi:putative DNA primase/helicase